MALIVIAQVSQIDETGSVELWCPSCQQTVFDSGSNEEIELSVLVAAAAAHRCEIAPIAGSEPRAHTTRVSGGPGAP